MDSPEQMKKELFEIIENLVFFYNIDDDEDVFFCKEANFPNMIARALELAREVLK